MDHLLEELTEPQRQAVTHTQGPLLVLAGAGSGKTRVITRRAAYIASTVASPYQILAITFTNKAANEMRERIQQLGGYRGMTVCTFHSLGARLLRTYAEQANLPSDFSIYDESDRAQVIKKAIAAADVSTSNWSPAMIQSRISQAKNALQTAGRFTEQSDASDYSERIVAKIYRCYEELMNENQAVDFDDLLMKPAFMLGENTELREYLEGRYRYLLIDEYQDTNHAQYMLARGLSLTHENICATGDPDQSIYAWRGADIRNILEFEQDFPKTEVVRLEQNYRSSKRIVAAASALIKNNQQRKDKELWTDNPAGDRIRVVEREDAEDEAMWLVEQIQAHRDNGGSYSDIAVFYRVNSLTRVLEEALLRAGISYQIARGTEFYNRKEIKDVLAYLRVLVNPADEIAFRRCVNTPTRGIGDTTVQRILEFAQVHQLTPLEAATRIDDIASVKTAANTKVKEFVALINRFGTLLNEPAAEIVEQVYKLSGLEAALDKNRPKNPDAPENVAELISAAADFIQQNPEGTLAEWLHSVTLVSDADGFDSQAGSVVLMTLHAAKGLEFPVVFIIGMEEGLLPHMQYQDDPEDIEEERRLCFVGITRAMKRLTLSYAKWRTVRGITQRSTLSQFLTELPEADLEWERETPEASYKEQASLNRQPVSNSTQWATGTYYRHPKFGVGLLLWKQASGKHTRAGVRFPSYGEKVLILEYAKMQPLDPDECQL